MTDQTDTQDHATPTGAIAKTHDAERKSAPKGGAA